MNTDGLADRFFRHEYARMVATLSRRLGVHHVVVIEDAVQSALMSALERWKRTGAPDNPSAWLFRVALNKALDELRTGSRRSRLASQQALTEATEAQNAAEGYLVGEVQDDLLRMLFVCCEESLPTDTQLALALKTLCGFSVAEIAQRLFASEANIYKRIERGRKGLAALGPELVELSPAEVAPRLPAVHRVLYLLFTEGHLSSRAELAIRRELCEESIRLANLVAEHPLGRTPETCALLALMHLHLARLDARTDDAGMLLLLEEQDRSQWDHAEIQRGLFWLSESASGDTYSRYHAEAAIAAEHCMAPSFAETRWDKVVESYELLDKVSPSPLHRLGLALATAEWKGAQAGLALLEDSMPPTWLEGSYQWSVVLADLHKRCGNAENARKHATRALELAPTEAVRELLARRLSD